MNSSWHPVEQRDEGVEHLRHVAQVLELRHLVVQEQEGERREVRDVVVEELTHHHLWVAEALVLVPVEPQPRLEELAEEEVVEVQPLLDVLPVEVAANQVAPEAVQVGDEVRARRVERIDERSRFTCQAPAVHREDLRGGVREILDHEEVLHFVEPVFDVRGELGLVPPQPLEHLRELD